MKLKEIIAVKAQVDTSNIGIINCILDSYDGIALLRTLDEKKGIVCFHVSPYFEKEFKKLVADLKKSYKIVLEESPGLE